MFRSRSLEPEGQLGRAIHNSMPARAPKNGFRNLTGLYLGAVSIYSYMYMYNVHVHEMLVTELSHPDLDFFLIAALTLRVSLQFVRVAHVNKLPLFSTV